MTTPNNPEATATATANPPVTAPYEDADLLALRAAEERLGTAAPTVERREMKPAEPDPEDADALVHTIAERQLDEARLRAEAERRREVNQDPRVSYKNADRGRVPVEVMVQSPKLYDPLACEDDDGTSLVKRDGKGRPYRVRWVRDKDPQMAISGARVAQMKQWGYEPVMKNDKTPLRLDTLVCMQCPIDQDVNRVIYHSRSGAMDKAKTVDMLKSRADEVNREYSRKRHGASKGVIEVQELEGHQTYRGGLHENYDY